jgi:hypothetical protein
MQHHRPSTSASEPTGDRNRSGSACGVCPQAARLYLRVLCKVERVLDVHAKVAYRALDFGVTQQELHRAQIDGRFVDDRCLGPPERMRAIILAPKADGSHPLIDQPGILPRADEVVWSVRLGKA